MKKGGWRGRNKERERQAVRGDLETLGAQWPSGAMLTTTDYHSNTIQTPDTRRHLHITEDGKIKVKKNNKKKQ